MALIDVEKQFDNIKKAAISAIQSIFPVSKDLHTLELNNVWVEEVKDSDDFAAQAAAKAKGGSWGANVYVDLSLLDKRTGKLIDREKKIKLFLLPILTHRASYIVNGNEYQVANQLRLKSGAYVKQMKGGGYKTQFNLAKGGLSPEMHITDKGVIRLKIRQGWVDLYPLLVGLGITPQRIKDVWGERVYLQNLETSTSSQVAVKKMADKLANIKTQSVETAKEGLKAYIKDKTSILPDMTKLTLGTEHTTFSPELWLDASAKLIGVHSGQDEPDDVDNLAYKDFVGVDDSIQERIEKNSKGILSKINRNLDAKLAIKQIINIGTFGNLIESFFTEDDRSAASEQINPLHMYAGHEKVTFLGPGSISDTQQVTDEMRNVHPTHFSYLDPVHTPESDKIGTSLGLAIGAEKVGRTLESLVYDIKTGKGISLTPFQTYSKIVAYPDKWDQKKKKFSGPTVKAQYRGKFITVPIDQVDYVMPYAQNAFSLSTNMIPFLGSDNGNRSMMAGKHMEQAIPLKDREVPLVQTLMPGSSGGSFEEGLGSSFSVYATSNGAPDGKPLSGVVSKLTKDAMYIKNGKTTSKINLYNNFVLNQKTFLNHEPTVSVGDKITGGQLVADSNYTKGGTLAMGTNLRMAYIPYKGYNFEDGIVITDTAAKKLTSSHMHRKEVGITKNTLLSLSKFLATFPNLVSMDNRDKLDSDGVIKKGSKVRPGDILIATLRDTGNLVGLEAVKATFDKSLGSRYKPKVEEWSGEVEGIVSEVQKVGDKITVFVKTDEPAQIGDKLAGRHGNKGIITTIIPDAQAPTNKEGVAVDIMLNPHGVVSRLNIGQIYESAMGKIQSKTGVPYKVNNFSGENQYKTVQKALKDAGMTDTEELINPETGKTLGQVHVGNPYMLKLIKQSSVNFSVRGETGAVAKSTLQPVKGGSEGTKAVDLLTLYSMLSHGAKANLQEMSTYKSENNPEFWEALKYGKHLPAPKTPFVFDKLVAMLKGAGVDVRKEGSKFYLAPLTDDQIKKLSKMEITNPAFVRASGNKIVEEKGGFLDLTHLGGATGGNWGHIRLKESIPNPIFEDAIKTLTNTVSTDYNAIVSGDKTISVGGKELTAGPAIRAMLDAIDVDQGLKTNEALLKTTTGIKQDKVIKTYRLLQALKDNKLSPGEAYMKQNVAVLPPKFRPVSALPESGDLAVDDVNHLYRNIAVINKHMKLPVVDLLADSDLVDVRQELYHQMKGLAGLETTKIGGRDKIGFIGKIRGSSPKEGFFQNKVLRKNQNLVGRGTIIPEPQLHMDQVALPEEMAWKLYSPFVIKNLIGQGMMANQAQKEVDGKSSVARRALDKSMLQRPVMLNRAPSLHKFSMMAFTPTITSGTAIKIPPLVVTGFNADFDGDTMTVHVPLTDKAVRESYKMMPSRNLYKPGTGDLMVGPAQESQLGFYLMTKTPKDRAILNEILPDEFHVTKEMDKKSSRELFYKLSKSLPGEQFSKLIDSIKILGETAAFEKGFTIGMKDLDVVTGRDAAVKNIEVQARKLEKGTITSEQFETAVMGKGGIKDTLDAHITKSLKGTNNALYEMYNSGARGKMDQLRQIVATPLLVQDPDGSIITHPIQKSFSEGLDMSDYWIASYGARKGMIDKNLVTQKPGVFNKALMAVTMDNIITEEDCGTPHGLFFPITSSDLLGRFIQGDQGEYTDETIIDETVLVGLKKSKFTKVYARSPLKCKSKRGTCRHCYGITENGVLTNVGDNVGVTSGQAIAEPLTQLTMNTFHSGGVAGTGQKGGYARIDELVQMPKNMKVGKAILSEQTGIVDSIEPSGLGGHNVVIAGKKYMTFPGLKLRVSKGDTVEKGDPLTDGSVAPQELLALKGMVPVQKYLTDELQKAYKGQGINIDRKTFETVVRSITNRTHVLNNVRDLPHLPGDSIPYTVAEDYNNNRKFKIGTGESLDYYLSNPTAGLNKGLKITNKEIKMLKGLGINELNVEREELEHEPYLKGITYLPLEQKDWLAQMGATRIKDAIVSGASQGWMSDVKDYHPIPAFAYGATFGEDTEGKY